MKKYETYCELALHPFVEDAFTTALSIQKEIDNVRGFSIKIDLKRNPTEREYYCLVLGTSMAHFLTTIQQLEHSVLLMSNFSPTEIMKEGGLTRATHLVWSVENFIIRTQTAYDRFLVLTDRLFNIQNPASRISHESIVTNGHIAATKIPSVLKPVRNSIKKYYYDRNTIIHEAPYHDEELRRLEGMSLALTSLKLDKKDTEYVSEHIKYGTRIYLNKKKREYKRINTNLCKTTANAFEVMHNIYRVKRKELA